MNTENNYQATDLGNISPNPRGDYDVSASYEYLDLVNMNGGSYICLAELGTTVTGAAPEPGKTTKVWQCVALPGNLTPEYIAMHDDVVNKAESVAEDTKNVTEMHENVTGMESNVQELQKQAAQSAEEAEASKDSAAGYARAADASRQAAEEAEANVNAQVTGFDSHVQEKTEESERAIEEARQAAVEVVSAATNTATNAAERAGSAASTAEEAKTAAAGSETNAAASASAAKTSETNAKRSETAAKTAMQATQDAAAGVAADREQITANKEGIAALKKNRSSAIVQTATGTSIVAQDSSDDPVRGLRVFGRTTQDGTPTPDAPVPLVSVGDSGSVEIDVYGKNLLENTAVTGVVNNVTFTVNDDYSVTANGTANSNNPLFVINSLCALKAGTYAITGCPSGGGSTKYSIQVVDESATVLIAEDVGSGATFTLEEDQNVYVRIRIVGNTTVSYLTFYPMICFASVVDNTYEPYAEKYLVLSTPNGLPGIPVTDESLANYTDADGQMWCSDEIDLERGVYVQRIGKLILDGSEDEPIRVQKNYFFWYLDNNIGATGRYWFYCNFYKNTGSSANDGYNAYINTGSSLPVFYDERFASEGEVRTWLSENPVKFNYVLKTPIETPLTDAELSAYQSLHSNYPVTTVLNDAGAHMEFSYNADPKNYIAAEHAKMEAAFDAKLAEIIALLPAETQAAMIDNETTNLLNESEE